jgi:biotin carboxylase
LTEAARLAKRLKLRYLNPASAALLRDKFRVRTRLAEHGLAQPEFALATSNHDLKRAVERLSLPLLIKPTDGYGSHNIVVLRDPEDLQSPLSPLDDLLPYRADYGLGVQANERALVERYMTGTVIGCDTLTANGRHSLLGIHSKLFFQPPSFAIRGACFSPDRAEFEDLRRYLFSALDAVKFDWGAAHTELMLTAEGPCLIEINARLVGAKLPRLVGYTLNRSVHADVIALHLGAWSPTPSICLNNLGVVRWIVADTQGILEAVQLPGWRDPRIRCVEILKRPGDTVQPPYENADRIGYVVVCGPSRAEAEQLADCFVSQTKIMLRSTPHPAAAPHSRRLEHPCILPTRAPVTGPGTDAIIGNAWTSAATRAAMYDS